MPFILIKGTFHVVGYSPDGDSIKFKADNLMNWKKIAGTPKLNKKEHVQLRLEAIDALETHYLPKVKGAIKQHQPDFYSKAARDFLIDGVGIQKVKFGPKNDRVSSALDGTKGFILARSIDNPKYGRPVSFVYQGDYNKPDGTSIHLDALLLKRSINFKLIEAGLAYPTFYPTLFYDLRNEIIKATIKSRLTKKGLWPKDKTMGLIFNNSKSITDDHPILPKLFRRLIEHLANGGKLNTFNKFLADKKDGVLILPQAHHTDALDYVIKIFGKKLSMTTQPENLIFDPQN